MTRRIGLLRLCPISTWSRRCFGGMMARRTNRTHPWRRSHPPSPPALRLARQRAPEGGLPMRRVTCNSLCGRTQRARPTVVSEGKLGRRVRYTGPRMPTHVVVPSVSRAAALQGTAGTIKVEPSAASFARPAFDCGFSGLPGSGASPPAETFPSGEGAVDVCAEAFEIRSRLSNAAVVTIRIGALLARITRNASRINRFRPARYRQPP